MGRLFSIPLDQSFSFDFDSRSYIAFSRFFLGLPPAITVGGLSSQPAFDYPVQRCLASHGVHVNPFLDANATHASSNCPAAQRDRFKKHNSVLRVLKVGAIEAGLSISCEPETFSLLLGEISKADCKRVFPKAASAAYKTAFTNLVNTIETVSTPSCTLSEPEKKVLIQAKTDELPLHDPKDSKGLRIDFAITNDSTGEVKWGDVTVVNTTSPSVCAAEFKAISDRQISKILAVDLKLPDLLRTDASPALLGRQVIKCEKYSRLMLIAGKQFREGKRVKMPTFTPYAVSNFGELSPAAVELQDWISDQYRFKCVKEGMRADGCTTPDLVRSFRRKLVMRTQLAIAAGIGGMICSAGLAWGSCAFS